MNEECINLQKCGFFIKHGSAKNLACKGFVALYCRGSKMSQCARLAHKKNTGTSPSDDMMPSGQMIKG